MACRSESRKKVEAIRQYGEGWRTTSTLHRGSEGHENMITVQTYHKELEVGHRKFQSGVNASVNL